MTARYLAFTVLWIAAITAVLLLAGGDWRWPQAWLFFAEYTVLAGALVVWLARHDPALLRERFTPPVHRDQATWDRVFLLGILLVFPAWLVLMGLDARRFALSHLPAALQAIGAAAVAGCVFVTWLTFRANSFAVPQVRVQVARGQRVIDDGPYRLVRHPMYTGAILFFLGIPLMLGSWYGLLAAPPIMVACAFRAIGEERLLRRDLHGYDAYAERVKYRLLPGIW